MDYGTVVTTNVQRGQTAHPPLQIQQHGLKYKNATRAYVDAYCVYLQLHLKKLRGEKKAGLCESNTEKEKTQHVSGG